MSRHESDALPRPRPPAARGPLEPLEEPLHARPARVQAPRPAERRAAGWHPAMLATLDWLNVGIAVVDERAVLLRANPAADAVLARATHVRLVEDRIVGAHAVASLQWSAVLRGARTHCGAQPSLARLTTPGSGELEVLAVAVNGAPGAAQDVLVVLNEPHTAPASAHDVLQRLYGLTTAEAQLALELARGRTVTEAAHSLRIAVATARTHLHHVLRKTRTRRQAELVGLVASGLAGRVLAGGPSVLPGSSPRTNLAGRGAAVQGAAPPRACPIDQTISAVSPAVPPHDGAAVNSRRTVPSREEQLRRHLAFHETASFG